MWNWDNATESLPLVLDGFRITLLATVLGSAVAMVLGLFIAVADRVPLRLVRMPVRMATEFIRSTPVMIQLFAAWLLLPDLSVLTIGIAVLGVHYAAYTSEVYRAGIDAVPRGQWEACTALSLPRHRVWYAVVLPQALRNVTPALGNYVISMFKETPFLSVIGVSEMVHQANEFGAEHFAYLETLTLTALVFLIVSYPTSLMMRRVERRLEH
ncbi:ectoine/hydroxyectoine ABC transporter permease subunit EhuD [Streptomyces soliscabiei]|uniref:ectoine/hydroxyectoine ABC transporter permease subunit EhuD n=1 Tax=Streptomyces soliscabiei TaxID=588897 RepID=UPI0029AEFD04|nr:ectoine/hydroxyectoine ABC transporter permease subunit EhuD [Streptomyces sp. NY05-11A]MDX2681665.1 ectoine/hydroxyectoine ABC transporter permease subunit EhuD [Streptomyces sp. NY05-11A]